MGLAFLIFVLSAIAAISRARPADNERRVPYPGQVFSSDTSGSDFSDVDWTELRSERRAVTFVAHTNFDKYYFDASTSEFHVWAKGMVILDGSPREGALTIEVAYVHPIPRLVDAPAPSTGKVVSPDNLFDSHYTFQITKYATEVGSAELIEPHLYDGLFYSEKLGYTDLQNDDFARMFGKEENLELLKGNPETAFVRMVARNLNIKFSDTASGRLLGNIYDRADGVFREYRMMSGIPTTVTLTEPTGSSAVYRLPVKPHGVLSMDGLRTMPAPVPPRTPAGWEKLSSMIDKHTGCLPR